MAFGEHWEWRGFGHLPRELRELIERLPRKFPDSQHVTDSYLFVPGCAINVKLREGHLKFKRLIETHAGLERWLEDENENHPFPLAPALVVKLAAELGFELEKPRADVKAAAGLLALLDEARAGVEIVAVEKERWQYDWSSQKEANQAGEPVTVELAEIRAPERVISVGIEHPSAASVEACRDALGIASCLRAASYLDALRVWAEGGRVG